MAGDFNKDYKSAVGPREFYDLVSALQFNLLTLLGLREFHFLLDIGCGSLRGGKLFIPYLLPNRYFGIEPNQWLIEEGIKNELGKDILEVKKPVFSNDSEFNLTIFNQKFDFILAQSIFSHASKKQILKCLSEAKKVMKKTSIFVATFFEGEKDYEGDQWYPGRADYTWDFMSEVVKINNLCCKKINWPHPAGQTWFVIYFPENERNFPLFKIISHMMEEKVSSKTVIYPGCKIEYLPCEEIEFIRVDGLQRDLLRGEGLNLGGLVLLKEEIEGEYKILVKDGEGEKEANWGLPSPGLASQYPDNPKAKKARFQMNGIKANEVIEIILKNTEAKTLAKIEFQLVGE